jgi:hypothetical protein
MPDPGFIFRGIAVMVTLSVEVVMLEDLLLCCLQEAVKKAALKCKTTYRICFAKLV